MKVADYQKWAISKNMTPAQKKIICQRLMNDDKLFDAFHGAFCIPGEAGEVVDATKKAVLYGKPIDVKNLKEELGDLAWYMNVIICAFGLTWEEVLTFNHDKLEERYPTGFSEAEAALRRDKLPKAVRIPKKPRVDVILEAASREIISCIKTIRQFTNLGLKDAADIVRINHATNPVITRTTYKKGYELADALTALGCKVLVR